MVGHHFSTQLRIPFMSSSLRPTITRNLLCAAGLFLLACATLCSADENGSLVLHARARVRTETPDQFAVSDKVLQWNAKKTAIVICDMWNEHWCRGATRRVAEMAPRMNEVIQAARQKGVLIIHCPKS